VPWPRCFAGGRFRKTRCPAWWGGWPTTSRPAADGNRYLMLDGWYPTVRIGKGGCASPCWSPWASDGDRVILDVRLVGDESTAAWRDVIHSLVARQTGIPTLAAIDGNPGLAAALREQWPTLAIPRCTPHKLRNLEAKAPARLREELAEEYRWMIYADSRAAVPAAAS
jgi:putative transposase